MQRKKHLASIARGVLHVSAHKSHVPRMKSLAWLCRQELHRGDAVRIRMSTNPVPTISQTDQTRDWFGSLERCFGWNDRAEQKPLGHVRRPDN